MARKKRVKDDAREKMELESIAEIEGDDELEDIDAPEDKQQKDNASRLPKRRSLAQMAAGTSSQIGVCCPNCGCGHLISVTKTWDVYGGRRRKRVCRNCGREWVTNEK